MRDFVNIQEYINDSLKGWLK